jgi:tetratricopeptide (TPR) repeat protein
LSLGTPEAATRHATAALAILAKAPAGDTDLLSASMESLLARSLLEQGDATAAEPLLRSALTRRVRRLPADDAEMLESLRDLASFVRRAPDAVLSRQVAPAWPGDAGQLAQRITADVPTLEQPDQGTVYRVAGLGRTFALGRIASLQKILLGPQDITIVRTLMAQMIAAGAERELEARVAAALAAVEILEYHKGKDHPSIVVCLEEASLSCYWLNQFEKAADLQRRACEIRARVPEFARDAMMYANSRRFLAFFLAGAGQFAQADPIYDECVRSLIASVGDEHHLVGLCQALHAWTLLNLGQPERADQLSARAMRIASTNPAIHQDQLQHIQAARARILLRLGRPEEAAPLFHSAWDPSYMFHAPWSTVRRDFIQDAVRTSELLRDQQAADWWRAQLDNDPASEPDASNILR